MHGCLFFFFAFPRSRDMEVKRYKGGKVFPHKAFHGMDIVGPFSPGPFF